MNSLPDAGKQVVDFLIGAVGVAFFLKLLPIVTGIGALVLIVLRIVVGVQEYNLNRRKLREPTSLRALYNSYATPPTEEELKLLDELD